MASHAVTRSASSTVLKAAREFRDFKTAAEDAGARGHGRRGRGNWAVGEGLLASVDTGWLFTSCPWTVWARHGTIDQQASVTVTMTT